MKDDLSNLFKERFTGHESPVDPGVWDAIQGQLGAGGSVTGDEGLKELLQERFTGHEMAVDPSVWANVSSQLGHSVAATSAGGSLLGPMGWAAAGVGVLAIAGAAYLFGPRAEPLPTAIAKVEQNTTAPASATSPEVETPASIKTEILVENTTPSAAPEPSTALERPTPENPPVLPDPAPPAPVEAPTAEPIQSGPEGAEIVENIISELTTRVTEEVLAEAAQRSTLGNSPATAPPSLPETQTPVKEEDDALPQLFLQNIFTPNGDGVNDTYFPVIEADAFERIMMRVYDVRNDRLVFNTTTNEPWSGDGCLDGYYLVAVEAMTPDGRLVTQGKVVWLNRNAGY